MLLLRSAYLRVLMWFNKRLISAVEIFFACAMVLCSSHCVFIYLFGQPESRHAAGFLSGSWAD
jgi:hypothetical protein